MTLNTRIWLHGTISGEDAFALSLRSLLRAAGREGEFSSARVRRTNAGALPDWVADKKPGDTNLNGYVWTAEAIERNRAKCDSITTVIGQGLPGIVDCDFRADGSPLATDDVWNTEYEDEHYIDQRKCHVELSWDTAYGYSEGGISCSELHARALVHLFQGLPAGVTMTWQNEFTGDIFNGLDGLEDFLGEGADARDWFRRVALPAIAADIARTA